MSVIKFQPQVVDSIDDFPIVDGQFLMDKRDGHLYIDWEGTRRTAGYQGEKGDKGEQGRDGSAVIPEDVLRFSPQELGEEAQIRARQNISAYKKGREGIAVDPNTFGTGVAYFNGSVNAPAFFPLDHSGMVWSDQFDENHVIQYAGAFHDDTTAYRRKCGGTWHEWIQLAKATDTPKNIFSERVVLGNWSIVATGGVLQFKYANDVVAEMYSDGSFNLPK